VAAADEAESEASLRANEKQFKRQNVRRTQIGTGVFTTSPLKGETSVHLRTIAEAVASVDVTVRTPSPNQVNAGSSFRLDAANILQIGEQSKCFLEIPVSSCNTEFARVTLETKSGFAFENCVRGILDDARHCGDIGKRSFQAVTHVAIATLAQAQMTSPSPLIHSQDAESLTL